jgi:hypothetical protein
MKSKSVKRTVEKCYLCSSRPLHGLNSFIFQPSSELLGYFRSSATADGEEYLDSGMSAPPTANLKIPEPAARATASHHENAIARFAGWHRFLILTWGSAALHPRLYATACSAG